MNLPKKSPRSGCGKGGTTLVSFVVTIGCESFLNTGGRKMVRTLQDPMSRRPAWRDRESETLWQFRI